MDTETRLKLIESVGEEILTKEELKNLVETKQNIIAYDGFEPSGFAHVPFAVFRAINLEKMQKAGVKFKIWLADYFAFINNKLGGDLKRIQRAGEYFIEMWRACGVDTSKVEIIWASDKMDNLNYWDRVLRVAKETKTLLEINAHPSRLDLRDEMIRTAVEDGNKLIIGTDAHSVGGLRHMKLGIGQARRGWAGKKDIANTMSWGELKKKFRK